MVPETKSFQIEIGGKTVTIETGKYAQSTNGSVTVRKGVFHIVDIFCKTGLFRLNGNGNVLYVKALL